MHHSLSYAALSPIGHIFATYWSGYQAHMASPSRASWRSYRLPRLGDNAYCAVSPPSMTNSAPVTNTDSSESR